MFKTRIQIATELQISTKTLNRWLKKSDIQLGRSLIGPQDQQRIYSLLGVHEYTSNGKVDLSNKPKRGI